MLSSIFLSLFMSFNLHAQSTIKIDGSSTVFPITEAMAEEFQTSKKGAVRVTVGISGTGGGFKKFCRGETDVQDASRPISLSEMESCRKAGVKYVELPIAYDAIVVAVNLKNDWMTEAAVPDLKKMWSPEAQGKVTQWDQVNAQWPKEKLKLFGAGSDSGTFDFFTEAIVGKAKSSRGDYTASEDDNTLVMGVANDRFALGYLPLAYYEANKAKLRALPVKNAEASAKVKSVLPSRETVENATYYLARPIFIYVSEASLKKPEVREFTEFYLKNAAEIVPSVKYVALPAKAYTMSLEHAKKNRVGSIFGGKEPIGMKIEDLLKREASM
ncbi:MAG: PstS family phosphate ABC transporter substrate-binding protein [Bdellovibrionaceae bacterium]|nr:PstS family phosphate ABC transporter substrate-binding protein [Pseudobdellovibrionaceae bacterium]MBX3035066.1 PstS family phosphate ABC transporter substrate-binding protein [Pseudobdellovibrionaceae bacterium]